MADRRRPPNDRRPPRVNLYDDDYEQRPPRRSTERRPVSRGYSDEPRPRRNEPRGSQRGESRNPRGRNTGRPQNRNTRNTSRGSRGGGYGRPKRTKLMTVQATLVIALFFGFVVAYMVLRAYGVLSQDVDIMTLRLGNMEHQQSVPGMIIRHEEVFQANRDGHLSFRVQEFDRVRAGGGSEAYRRTINTTVG